MREETITIERMAFGGAGLGHVAGKVCFVPFTAPGDEATILVGTEKRSYMQGELKELLIPSPLRVAPPCPVFGSCGGCNWQHLSYSAQMEIKQEIFADSLRRFGRVDPSRILPLVPAPEPYEYRSRVQFKIHRIDGMVHMGFYRAGTHRVVDIPGHCAIAKPLINSLFLELQSVLSGCPEADSIPQVDVTVGDDDAAVLVFHYIGKNHGELTSYLEMQKWVTPAALYLQSDRKNALQKISGPESLSYHVPPDFLPGEQESRLAFSPGGFSQVNYRQNLELIKTVFQWSELTGKEKILDLFCGNGNFSIPLSRRAAMVVGIEDFAPSIADARRNCERNGVENASYHCADAVAGLLKLKEAGETFDLILLDPPRTGAADLVRHIPSLKPSRVIYVSCDPVTLARDLGTLGTFGYEVVKSVPVDMFPQTYHTESVTLLTPTTDINPSG